MFGGCDLPVHGVRVSGGFWIQVEELEIFKGQEPTGQRSVRESELWVVVDGLGAE